MGTSLSQQHTNGRRHFVDALVAEIASTAKSKGSLKLALVPPASEETTVRSHIDHHQQKMEGRRVRNAGGKGA
jgi:hypothetical protein